MKKIDEFSKMDTIAVHGSYPLELKGVIYDIDDKVLILSRWGQLSAHTVRVYYGARDYIRLFGMRLYLDEFLRV